MKALTVSLCLFFDPRVWTVGIMPAQPRYQAAYRREFGPVWQPTGFSVNFLPFMLTVAWLERA